MLEAIDVDGVLPLLVLVAGFCTLERGSQSIEPIDLLKAMYIADFDHVAPCWANWEDLERFVLGGSRTFVNRTLLLIQIHSAQRDPGESKELARVSSIVNRIVAEARKFANERVGSPSTPSTRELLYHMCSLDEQMSAALQKSGLDLERLESLINKT